ncbi:SLC26A/SulP transporter family protein [Roseovarius aestuariivivens]|uniref:SLC26A/SulP transporter family protein n=1 Tax=Roseovarius aestuariivivens TaxID=1888910 RepID=UPI0014366D80|nr:SulP family inorganic anion transporter [Roseovarius aestuariivivens]
MTKSTPIFAFRAFQFVIGSVVIGTMAVTLTLSFAALVYTGPLAMYLGTGASLILFAAALMSVIGALTYSVRGSIANPQDATAVVLGSAAIGIASSKSITPDALFPTILALLAVACLMVGASAFLAGVLRLGALVRYAPYPVIAGFLAATGYLLVIGGLSIATRESVTAFNLAEVLKSVPLSRWLPWVAAGLALALITKWFPGDFTLPVVLVLAALTFYSALALNGISIETALARDMLLGPFDETDTGRVFDATFLAKIEWAEILAAAPTLGAVTGLALLGSLLNTTGFAVVVRETTDTERDMRATGLVNLVAAPLGGLPGYTILGESILARRMGLGGHVPGLVAAFACAGAAYAGTAYLAYAPAGLMAMIVCYLGFDLLGSWLLTSRKRMSSYEYVIVLMIVFVTATFGFLEAIALGTLSAALIFVVTYARTDVVRLRSSLAQRHSWVERSEEELAHLKAVGHAYIVLDLSGFLFFGTVDKVASLVRAEIKSESEIRYLILDFRRVTGLDAAASASLIEMVRLCRSAGVEITFCSISTDLERQIREVVPRHEQPRINGSLNAELERVEDRLLTEAFGSERAYRPRILELVHGLEEEYADRPDVIHRVALSEGQEFPVSANGSDSIFVVCSGKLRSEVPAKDGRLKTVAKLRAGALIGELGYYTGVRHSALVVAETVSNLVHIDLRQLGKSRSDHLMEFHKACGECLARRLIRLTDQLSDHGLGPR